MNSIIHERPGVYSTYDASVSLRGGRAVRVIGVAAKSKTGTPNTPVTITSYEMGVSVFGEDDAASPGMSTLLKLLFLGGCPWSRLWLWTRRTTPAHLPPWRV